MDEVLVANNECVYARGALDVSGAYVEPPEPAANEATFFEIYRAAAVEANPTGWKLNRSLLAPVNEGLDEPCAID